MNNYLEKLLSIPHPVSFFFSLKSTFPPVSTVLIVEDLNAGFSLTMHIMIKVHSTFPARLSNQAFCTKCIYPRVLRPKDSTPTSTLN